MKKLIFTLMVYLILVRCAPSSSAISTAIAQTQVAAATLTSTLTQIPSKTPMPTRTKTPRPTNTPRPQPIEISGSGDDIVDLAGKWYGPAVAHITHTGSSNFIVYTYDAYGNKLDLLLNEIGHYDGIKPFNILEGEEVTRLEIKADGVWKFYFTPFDTGYMHSITVPGTYKGAGDDLFLVFGNPDIGTFSCTVRGNFVVYAYGDSGRDLLINEIAPYSGKTIIPKDTFMLEVIAPGEWTVEITKR